MVLNNFKSFAFETYKIGLVKFALVIQFML